MRRETDIRVDQVLCQSGGLTVWWKDWRGGGGWMAFRKVDEITIDWMKRSIEKRERVMGWGGGEGKRRAL